jgi:predicted DNA-binding antitoxin AbrB/MazE fold protein
MTLKVNAVQENGVLRPLEPLDLPDHQEFTVSICTHPEDDGLFGNEFPTSLEGMGLSGVSHEEVRRRLAGFPGSHSDEIIAEREERF